MHDKASLRKEILAKRDSIPPDLKKIKDKAIEDRLFSLDEFRSAKTILFFASFRSEVDTFGIIRRALEQGRRAVLPKVEGRDLVLYEIKSIDELAPGYMGIPEPSVLTEVRRFGINDVDAIIIPGAVFDASGNRIGYGGGYYDRLLGNRQLAAPVIAVCYEEQLAASVPSEPHDIAVQVIITDEHLVKTGACT